MAERKPQWPETGDLIIATIETVTDYGAYAKLDEYEKRGLLHVSEISSSWIRNIRDFVREGQKVVLKVLRVDHEKGHIDLSLRRVTKRERIDKVLSWKKERKAEALLHGVAEKVGLSSDEVYQKTGPSIATKFDLYEAFEKSAVEGPEVLAELGVPENLAKAFSEVAQERIHVKMVKVRGVLEVRVTKPNGVKVIKEAFTKAKSDKVKDANIKLYVIAAPKYSLEVQAENYKRAEDVLQKTAQNVVTLITKAGGQGNFRREK
ncbi:MAG TPA: translation initiation factor IF-2 subunit alpha [Candidatus Deferrimicrobiaceae bacterium]|jgi:translation initiation factor 2 subunit 1|nr:translation initiation factor IF-2 subunit alpha [Candidatus Deferrimicrobiaceae bacterium]